MGDPSRTNGRPARLPPAVVLGNTNLIRALALAGIRSTVVARANGPAAQSRFVDGVIPWADNWGDPATLRDNLLAFAAGRPEPPVLFFQHDGDLMLVSRHRTELARACRFAIASRELIEQLVDKARFAPLAAGLGLPAPRSAVLHPEPGRDVPGLDLEFPIVLKPLTRRDRQWRPVAGKAKALRVESATELAERWWELCAREVDLVAQELVAGAESGIESYHVYVDERGDVAAEFTGRKIRTLPPRFGETTALEITDAGDVRELGRHCVERLGLTGVAKLDFKRAPDGRLFLLEVNPRFNLWHLPGAVAGVNIPATVYADLAGRPRPAGASVRVGVRWSVPWQDLQAARADGLSLARWLAWQARCDTRHVLALDDPLPFARGMVWRRLRGRLGGRAR